MMLVGVVHPLATMCGLVSFGSSLSLALYCASLFRHSQSHTHTHSLSLTLVVMIKSKELKTKISHAHSLILSLVPMLVL